MCFVCCLWISDELLIWLTFGYGSGLGLVGLLECGTGLLGCYLWLLLVGCLIGLWFVFRVVIVGLNTVVGCFCVAY